MSLKDLQETKELTLQDRVSSVTAYRYGAVGVPLSQRLSGNFGRRVPKWEGAADTAVLTVERPRATRHGRVALRRRVKLNRSDERSTWRNPHARLEELFGRKPIRTQKFLWRVEDV